MIAQSHCQLSATDPRSLANLDGDVLVLAGRLGGEHVGDLGVRRGLPADGALDRTPPGARAVLLHDDGDAAVAEAVAAGQHRPLEDQKRRGGGCSGHGSKVPRDDDL